MAQEWEDFYKTHKPPVDFDTECCRLSEFCAYHEKLHNNIVLITSGGTTVPLEHNTVRFVDNFSAGLRGSASAEYFLKHNYAVIFMYRHKSLEPYSRQFTIQQLLNMLEIDNSNDKVNIRVKTTDISHLSSLLETYRNVHDTNRILYIKFTTIADYFWLLRAACERLVKYDAMVVLYLAAAVSDFYIPSADLPTHKMQSERGPPTIHLQLVPKLLAPIVTSWLPHAFIVSFKLETEEDILISKARSALKKYKHKLVIGNLLQSRRDKVVFVTENDSEVVTVSKEDIAKDVEIEKLIVSNVVDRHNKHISSYN